MKTNLNETKYNKMQKNFHVHKQGFTVDVVVKKLFVIAIVVFNKTDFALEKLSIFNFHKTSGMHIHTISFYVFL